MTGTEKSESPVRKFFMDVSVKIVAVLLITWVCMLLMGAWHDLRPSVPPTSFFETLVVAVLIERATVLAFLGARQR